ncbi:MAG: hypothetical protein ACXVHI_08010, partial [Frankiaceae bacterium]
RREVGDAGAGAGGAGAVDLDVRVVCTTGTYVRALARDLGAALGVGASLTGLRRTRSGYFSSADARTLAELAGPEGLTAPSPSLHAALIPLPAAVEAAFPRRDVDAVEARAVAHGGRLSAVALGPGPYGVFGPEGQVLALVEEREGLARYLAVFAAGGSG